MIHRSSLKMYQLVFWALRNNKNLWAITLSYLFFYHKYFTFLVLDFIYLPDS